jgi:hypothetical protein
MGPTDKQSQRRKISRYCSSILCNGSNEMLVISFGFFVQAVLKYFILYLFTFFHFLLLPLLHTSIERFNRCRSGGMGRKAPTAGRGGGGEVQAAGAQPRPGAYQLGFVIVHMENSK